MELQKVISKHIDKTTGNIRCNSKNLPIKSKEELIQLFKVWIQLNKGKTSKQIGMNNHNQVPCLYLEIEGYNYFINSDTKIDGVEEFFKYRKNEWRVIVNNKGVKNKVTNHPEGKSITNFFMYKE